MTRRILTIRLGTGDWRSHMRKAARKASGARTYQGEELVFHSPALLFGQLTELRWELIRTIQGKGPMSIRKVARRVDRGSKRVHEDVTALLDLGLLERTDQAGVECPFQEIHVDLRLMAEAA